MKRIVYKTALMISLSSVAAAGCTAGSADRTLPVQEECFVETSEAVGQEDSGMAEAGMNGADQAIIAEADKKETEKEHTAEKETEVMDQMPVTENQETYRSLVKKVWIEDWPERQFSDAFEFIITRIEAEKIEGVIVFGDDVASCYWSNIKKLQQRCRPFQGTIHGNQSVCTFRYEGYPAEVE